MDLTDIASLFQSVLNVSQYNKKHLKNFNGQDFWQPIKQILSRSDYKASKWKKIAKKKYDSFMELPEYIINGYGDKLIIEENHFLIQTVRIPNHEEPSLRKIIQIALNIGQYQGLSGNILDSNKIYDFILKSDCKISLNSIMKSEDISYLEKYFFL